MHTHQARTPNHALGVRVHLPHLADVTLGSVLSEAVRATVIAMLSLLLHLPTLVRRTHAHRTCHVHTHRIHTLNQTHMRNVQSHKQQRYVIHLMMMLLVVVFVCIHILG